MSAGLNNPGARRKVLLESLRKGVVNVEDLSMALEVSPATVRRDLMALSREGLITRTYGGAAIASGAIERSLRQRATLARGEKQAIAAAALADLKPGMVVYLDAGTTVGALAEMIAARAEALEGLIAVTHSLSVVNALCEAENIELVVLGGTLRKISQGMLGPLTEQALESFRFDLAFLGADAVSPRFGIGETTLVQVRLKQLIMARAGRVAVLADASKLAGSAAPYWAALPDGAELITNAEARGTGEAFRRAGLRVRQV
jgi:DeoR family fructose operon transcriptional repressor